MKETGGFFNSFGVCWICSDCNSPNCSKPKTEKKEYVFKCQTWGCGAKRKVIIIPK